MGSPANTVESSGLFLWTAIVVQSVCWCGSLIFLAWYFIRSMNVLNDLGVEVSRAEMAVISVTNLIVSYWFVIFPIIILIIAGTNAFFFAMIRSTAIRVFWVAVGCVMPFILTGWMFHTIRQFFERVHRELA